MEESKMIRVVMVRPGEIAEITEIGTGLENLQAAVDGMIEPYYGLDDSDYCIVCNDEGKINGMRPNRAIYGEENEVRDIIFGPFLICGTRGPELASLSEEQLGRYGRRFECPEHFYRLDGKIAAVPYIPGIDKGLAR